MKYLFFGMLTIFLFLSCSQEEITLTDNYAVASSRTGQIIDNFTIVANGVSSSYSYDRLVDTMIGNIDINAISTRVGVDADGDGNDDHEIWSIKGDRQSEEANDSGGTNYVCIKSEADCVVYQITEANGSLNVVSL